jgi:hypothetical protein
MPSPALVADLFEGPLDIVGDVHGELGVLRDLMARLGYDAGGDHPAGRRLVFLGDLCDRGPDSPGVIELVRSLIERGRAQCILGNHELNALRHAKKDGNAWYFDEGHPSFEQERAHSKPAPRGHAYHSFFLSLPLVLERADLRLVHAAWDPSAANALRTAGVTSLELFQHHEDATRRHLEQPGGIAVQAKAEKQQYGAALFDRSTRPPLLENLGKLEELKQTLNPVRVLTSGPERVTAQPFFANGKWRMCDRVKWWNAYTDDVPVIVGHYWRIADHDGEPDEESVSSGKPNLFAGHPAHAWVGAKQNVFCVDFSIGGRHKERARGHTTFKTRLAAVRWPERELVFADGPTLAMVPGFTAD